jgi:gliding motility-associated-like protein
MRNFTFLLFALLFSLVGYSQFPTPGTEGFESANGPDLALPVAVSPWSLGTGATGNQWAVFDNGVAGSPQRRWDQAPSNFYSGTHAAFINRKQNGAAGVTSEDYLATPLVTVPTNGQLTFYTRTGFNSPDDVNYVIKVNTNTAAGSQTTPANYTNTVQTWNNATPMLTAYNVYELKTVNLSAFAGQQVYIAFVRVFNQPTASLGGNSWYIDDVKLVQRCLEPTAQTVANITTTTANLSWTPNGSTSWEIEVVPATGTPTGSGVVYNGALPYIKTGLTPATSYVYYVRALCSDSNSNWVGPFSFTTATPGLTCAAPITISSIPYSTNDNTANYGDTYDTAQPTACAGTATNYMTGNDVFYSYTPTTSGIISITMTPGATNSGIFVYQGCANVGVTCVGGVANATTGVRSIPNLSVTAGLTYIIVVSSRSTTQTVPYSLVIQQVNCAQPTALAATAISLTGATLSWTNATSTSWEYVVQTAGSAIPTGTGITTLLSTGTTVAGLNPDTAYQYWVRADCGNGTFSAWSGPFLFNTLVPPPACGGIFTDAAGQTTNYANNSDSTVTICPSTTGEAVTVTFTSFDVQATSDGLYIFNGNSITAPQFASSNPAGTVPGGLAGAYWGTTNPGSFTSSSADGCLTFRFRSNATTNAAGWVANVTCGPPPVCPKPLSITSSAVLSSSVNLAWVEAGTATAWEVIAMPCGTLPTAASVGVAAPTNPFTLTTGLAGETCYDIYVRSICSGTDVSPWTGPTTITTQIAPPACGGTFSDPQGVNAQYNNSLDSTVTICPTTPGQVVTVTFTSFDTEANWDGLYVFDGNAITAPQIASANGAGNVPGGLAGSYWGALTGANLPGPFTGTSANGCLTFRFRTDTSGQRAGWVANVTCAPPPTCPKPNTLVTSAVTSNSATLSWVNPSTATAWEVVALPCNTVPNASTVWTPTTTNPHTFTGLNSDTCYDLFVRGICPGNDISDISGPKSITTQIAPPACGGTFTDPQGATAQYINSLDNTVTICPTIPGQQVTVTFTSFDTEANWDGLYVFDGNSNTSPQLASTNGAGNVPGGIPGSYWGLLTGANLPGPFTASSLSGCLTFRFRSDGSAVRDGWVANVTCAPPPTCPKPTAVTVTGITQTSAIISWTEIGAATSWEVLILPAGSPVPTATTTGGIVTTNPYIATPLNPATPYVVYVRSLCSLSDISLWSNVKSFTTLIANDECSGATVAPVNPTNTCVQSVPGSLVGATNSTNATTCGGTHDDDVWFQFTATSTTHTINLNNVVGSTTDLFHVLYSGSCGTLTQIYCSDPNNSIANSLVVGQTYYVRVYSWTATPNQTTTFNLCIGTPTPPPSCITNTPAGNSCATATPICNINGYCGNTSTIYSPTHTWTELSAAFCGSLENNSFLSFVATSSTISFDVWVTSSQNADGIQIMVFSAATCGSGPVTNLTCWSPGTVAAGSTNVSATGLIPGNTYYIMIDGFAGDVCDYVIASNSGIQTPVAINTNTSTTTSTICLGQSATLNATGGNGIYTWSPSANLSATTGSSVVFTPTAVGVYPVTATSTDGNIACPQSASSTQTITVVDYVTPTFNQIAPFCVGTTPPVLPTSSTNTPIAINGTWSPSVVSNTTPGTTTYTFTPSITQCATPVTMDITVLPGITPTFLTPAPICSGATAPVLPTTSSNNPTPITGTWNPPTVSNTASGTYTFTPNSGQCASTTSLNVTVNTNCSFGSYASALWLTNCGTSNFFNTVGSGADIIGPAANVFPNANLGTYVQGSNALILRGAEVKTFKSASSNVCSANLNYRVFSGTPSGTFNIMTLPFFDNCGSGSFPISGGPCNTGDQKWQRVVADGTTVPYSPVDLTAYPPGNYTIQVYYDISGSSTSTSACDENILIDNNGAYYTATFTIQAQPVYASANPITCGGSNGSITITGMAPNTTYSLTYNDDTTVVGPINVSSNTSGTIVINNLNSGTYSNFLLTINGCSLANNTSIVLVDPSIPTVTVNSATVCNGLSATIAATPGSAGTYSYVWTVPTGATNPGNVGSFSASVDGTYGVVITNTVTGCSSTSASGTLTLSPIIIPTFSAIAPICSGDTAPLLLTSSTNTPTAITGSWSPSVIDNTASGVYTFTPDAGQCSQPLTINVTVNSVPTPTATIVAQPTCVSGGTVQITSPLTVVGALPTDLFISEVTDSNAGSLSYIEIYNGTGVSKNLSNYSIKTASNGGAYTFTLPLNNVTLASGSNYVVALGNDNFCPSISGGNGSLAAQSNASGSVNFASNGNDHFALFNGATKIDSWGVFGSNNWAPSSVGTEGGDFRRKTNATHPSTTYNNNDWDIIDYVGSGICANNDYSNIGVYALPASATYQYNVDGGVYQSSPTFSGLTPGLHTFTVQNTATGCTSSVTVTLNAIPGLPTITGTLSACVGNTTQLTGSATPATTNAWTSSNTSVATISSSGLVTGVAFGTTTITYTNTAGCQITETVTINALPTVSVNSPVICAGAVATITATPSSAGTYSYVWTVPAGVTNPGDVATFTTTDAGVYSVVITDTATGCSSASASGTVTVNALPTVTVNSPTVCQGTNAVVTAIPSPTGTYSYVWTVPTGATNPGDIDSFTATLSGTYTVVITDTTTGCTSLAATSTVTINANPIVTVNSSAICAGAVATVTATPSPAGTYSYVWTVPVGVTNPGDVATFTTTDAGVYSVVITDTTTGCSSASASGTVSVNANPTVTVNSPTVCQGTNAVVTATPSPAGTYSYVWTVPTGATNPGNVASFTATVSGTYSVVITNSATGCFSSSATSTVTINANPVVVVTGDSVCQGNLATISTTITPTGTYNYVWTVPSGANPGNVPTFTTAISGTYSVIATNTVTGCSSTSQSGVATISPAFSFTITDACVNNNFTLEVVPNANSFDVNTANFTWQYAGNPVGTNSSTFDVTSYLNSTTAVETLPLTFSVIVQSNGCQQTDAIVLNRIYCQIQKGISPNNDGKNENFDLRQMNVQQLSIYNRYGTKVYSKSEYSNEWVGQSDAGNELPDGTYYYVIEFKNNQASKTGWIYINRQN